MATLVLTAAGNMLGGPIGGAIGAMIGQHVDRSWLAPTREREGPRLKELAVQTSSYGTQIPAIFGAMRVAGTVIWATDIVEHSNRQGGGKGRPSTVDYSYSVSMAVALSSRPITRVGRIWADGNLLRGAEGDLKYETQLRFYLGHGDQLPDPLIASAEVTGQCAAHRGIAYAVFEDLQLGPFGNRIPQLTFELFEREGVVPVIDIARSITAFVGDAITAVDGYALAGDSGRAALAPLLSAMPVLLRSNLADLELIDWPANDVGILPELLRRVGSREVERPQSRLEPANDVPHALVLRHYEPERDFQLGVQRAESGDGGRGERQMDVPAALAAETARALAQAQLLDSQFARDGWTGHIATDDTALRPGDWIEPYPGQRYRIDSIEHGHGEMRIEARRALAILPDGAATSPGRHVGATDEIAGETRLMLADLPAIGSDPGRPLIAAFAAGTAPGWRRAALSLREGDDSLELGGTALPAIIGEAESSLAEHGSHLVDDGSGVIVQLLHGEMDLPSGTGSPLDINAPLCLLGDEYLRYGSAIPLDSGRFHLTKLVRGLYGSFTAHFSGDLFVLIDSRTAKEIDAIRPAIGQTIEVEALGLGDTAPAIAVNMVSGRAVIPLSPVHGRIDRLAENALRVEWKWRSRVDAGWQDGVDQPCCEDSLRFSVDIFADSLLADRRDIAAPTMDIGGDEIASWLPVGGELRFDICQIGRHARSQPLQLIAVISA